MFSFIVLRMLFENINKIKKKTPFSLPYLIRSLSYIVFYWNGIFCGTKQNLCMCVFKAIVFDVQSNSKTKKKKKRRKIS